MKLFLKSNFIPQETKNFKDREPLWINNKVTTMIQEKKKVYQLYMKNRTNVLETKFETQQTLIYERKPWRVVIASTIKTTEKNYALKP